MGLKKMNVCQGSSGYYLGPTFFGCQQGIPIGTVSVVCNTSLEDLDLNYEDSVTLWPIGDPEFLLGFNPKPKLDWIYF